jgi:hypothetical protein
MGRVQGEGDYEAARRYRARTRRFMDQRGAEAANPESGLPAGGVDDKALREAKRRAKAGDQDARDARLLTEKVRRSKTSGPKPKAARRKPSAPR